MKKEEEEEKKRGREEEKVGRRGQGGDSGCGYKSERKRGDQQPREGGHGAACGTPAGLGLLASRPGGAALQR